MLAQLARHGVNVTVRAGLADPRRQREHAVRAQRRPAHRVHDRIGERDLPAPRRQAAGPRQDRTAGPARGQHAAARSRHLARTLDRRHGTELRRPLPARRSPSSRTTTTPSSRATSRTATSTRSSSPSSSSPSSAASSRCSSIAERYPAQRFGRRQRGRARGTRTRERVRRALPRHRRRGAGRPHSATSGARWHRAGCCSSRMRFADRGRLADHNIMRPLSRYMEVLSGQGLTREQRVPTHVLLNRHLGPWRFLNRAPGLLLAADRCCSGWASGTTRGPTSCSVCRR